MVQTQLFPRPAAARRPAAMWRDGFPARTSAGLLLAALAAVGARAGPPGPEPQDFLLGGVAFRGNERTRDAVLLRELDFAPGDRIAEPDAERGRQAIMDLGLFSQVDYELLPDPAGVVVRYTVREKHYWLAWPKLDRGDEGELTFGAAVEAANLFGLNHGLELEGTVQRAGSAEVEEEQELSAEYVWPRMFGSPYGLTVDLELQESTIDERRRDGRAGRYERELESLSVFGSRWLRRHGPSRGWRLGAGLLYEQYQHDLLEGDPGLYFNARVLTWRMFVEYLEVHDLLYSRAGRHARYTVQQSDPLGSGPSLFRFAVFYRRYRQVTAREHTGLHWQLSAGSASGTVFGEAAFAVGGSRLLRGFDREDVEGDAYAVANLEFLTPLFGKKALRGVVFADAGNAWPDAADFDPTDLELGLGAGLRWKLRSFVKTDLRVDVARGLGPLGRTEVYAATRATF